MIGLRHRLIGDEWNMDPALHYSPRAEQKGSYAAGSQPPPFELSTYLLEHAQSTQGDPFVRLFFLTEVHPGFAAVIILQ